MELGATPRGPVRFAPLPEGTAGVRPVLPAGVARKPENTAPMFGEAAREQLKAIIPTRFPERQWPRPADDDSECRRLRYLRDFRYSGRGR